jgi:Zn-dependent peptidase ImmA (M78 family)
VIVGILAEMVLQTNTGTDIEAKAAAVLGQYGTQEEPEAIFERVCSGEGITLLEADLRDIGGILRHEAGSWRIYLNRRDAPPRRRFTLAHLLGHYFLHAAPGRAFVEGRFVDRH